MGVLRVGAFVRVFSSLKVQTAFTLKYNEEVVWVFFFVFPKVLSP